MVWHIAHKAMSQPALHLIRTGLLFGVGLGVGPMLASGAAVGEEDASVGDGGT